MARRGDRARDFTGLSLSAGITAATGLALSLWLTRTLGPSEFGRYCLLLAFAGCFDVIGELGLTPVVTRSVARNDPAAARRVGSALQLKAALGVAGAILSVPLGLYLDLAPPALLVLVTLLWLPTTLTVLRGVLEGRLAFGRQAGIETAHALALLLVIPLGLAIQLTVGLVLAVRAGAAGLVSLLYWRLATPLLRPRWDGGPRLWPGLIRESWPLALGDALRSGLLRPDLLLLGLLVGSAAVGQYGAAARIYLVLHLPAGVLLAVMYPLLCRADGTPEFDPLARRMFRRLAWGGAALALATIATAPRLIPLAFGEPFRPAAPFLAAMAPALVPAFALWGAHEAQVARNRPRSALALAGAALVTTTVWAAWAAPHWGGAGVAVGLTLAPSATLVAGAMHPATRRTCRAALSEGAIPAFLAAAGWVLIKGPS